MNKILTNREIYTELICKEIPKAKEFCWIATADIKDLYVDIGRKKMVPFLSVLSNLADKGVEIRLIHAKEPGQRFRDDFDKYPNLIHSLEMMLCPRNHTKSVIIDGKVAWFGSANLTGAGMGAKSENRRNFEISLLTDVEEFIDPIVTQFDNLWLGTHCSQCGRKAFCSQFNEMV